MKIEIWCNTHRSPVIPGRDSDSLYWLTQGPGEFELSYNALECTGGRGDHEFVVTAINSLGVGIYDNSNTSPDYINNKVGGPSNKNDGTCWCCGGLEGTHVVRSCAGQSYTGTKTEPATPIDDNAEEPTIVHTKREDDYIGELEEW
jgi:hypothetical protein